MSQNPIGTTADGARLVELRVDDGPDGRRFFVDAASALRDGGPGEGDAVDWTVETDVEAETEHAGPALVFGRIDDGDVEDATHPDRLEREGETFRLEVPERLLAAEDGLSLDLDAYDESVPLLFEPATLGPVGDTGGGGGRPAPLLEEAVALVPVRYADGTPFDSAPRRDVDGSSDPVAEAQLEREGEDGDGVPRSAVVDAAVDSDLLDAAVDGADVSREDLVAALESLERQRPVDESASADPFEPVSVEDRIVLVVAPETWSERVAPALDADAAVVDAARAVHRRQADRLLSAGEVGDGTVEEEYEAVVFRREID